MTYIDNVASLRTIQRPLELLLLMIQAMVIPHTEARVYLPDVFFRILKAIKLLDVLFLFLFFAALFYIRSFFFLLRACCHREAAVHVPVP